MVPEISSAFWKKNPDCCLCKLREERKEGWLVELGFPYWLVSLSLQAFTIYFDGLEKKLYDEITGKF